MDKRAFTEAKASTIQTHEQKCFRRWNVNNLGMESWSLEHRARPDRCALSACTIQLRASTGLPLIKTSICHNEYFHRLQHHAMVEIFQVVNEERWKGRNVDWFDIPSSWLPHQQSKQPFATKSKTVFKGEFIWPFFTLGCRKKTTNKQQYDRRAQDGAISRYIDHLLHTLSSAVAEEAIRRFFRLLNIFYTTHAYSPAQCA